MKKIVFLIVPIIFILLSCIIFSISEGSVLKINAIIQLAYTFVTIILVILTYLVLRNSENQRHQSVQPYLFLSDLDYYMKEEEFEFNVFNEGEGLAKDIELSVFDENDNNIYSTKIYRLKKMESPIVGATEAIATEISEIRKEIAKSPNGTFPIFCWNYDKIEFKIKPENIKELSLRVELKYKSIYGRDYKTKINIIYDLEADEVKDYKENFEEK